MLNKEKNNKGFTLVELLVVIAIIGILAVVAVPALFKNIEKGKVAELESDISAIRSAALSYYADNGTYPTGALTGQSVTNELLKEIEGLSNPFAATYTLGNQVPPNTLKLTIVTSKLSDDGFKKLKNDLGEDVIPQNTKGDSIEVNIIKGK